MALAGIVACRSAPGPETGTRHAHLPASVHPQDGPPPAASSDLRAPGTRKMAERLEAIARATAPLADPYLNRERAAALAAVTPPSDPAARARYDFLLADELLLAGETAEAVERLRALESVVGPEQIRSLLAIALLRLGEQANCLGRHTADSCLFPIGEGGVHKDQRGSRQAIAVYLDMLRDDPDDLGARWLLNLAYMTVGEYPAGVPERWLVPPEVFRSDHDIGRFRDVAPLVGLDTVGLAGGAVLEDLDGDELLDVMVSSSGLRDQIRYFHNDGDGRFSDRTAEAGLEGIVGGLNTVHADYDNDGNPDVLVLRGAWLDVAPATDGGNHPNSLLRNLGGGVFADVTEEAGLLEPHPTQTAAWGDFDNDGWLDLFVGNESYGGFRNPCQLFHNNRDGTFTDVAAQAGVAVLGLVKGVAWGDYDGDGRQDLFVSRLGEPNLLYRNAGPGPGGTWTFEDVAARAHVTAPLRSFPTWFWDYDNDGRLDIFVSGYGGSQPDLSADVLSDYLGLPTTAERIRLFHNRGDGTFEDVTRQVRLDHVVFTMGCNYGDLDNDGFPDMYLGTGDPDLRSIMPNRMFRNAGGTTFQDVTTSGGFGHLQKGHGVAFGDVDNDGDQDVFAVLGGFFTGDVYPNVLFENPGHGNRWIVLQLQGVRSNRSAIGARIRVRVRERQSVRDVYSLVGTGGSFGSSPLRREIGLGRADAVEEVAVTWPATGRTDVYRDLEPDRAYLVREGEAPMPLDLPRIVLGGGGVRAAGAGAGHPRP